MRKHPQRISLALGPFLGQQLAPGRACCRLTDPAVFAVLVLNVVGELAEGCAFHAGSLRRGCLRGWDYRKRFHFVAVLSHAHAKQDVAVAAAGEAMPCVPMFVAVTVSVVTACVNVADISCP